MSQAPIVLLPIFFTRAGAADKFAEHVAVLEAASRAETGCIEYTVYRDEADENRFVLFELWADAEALAEHNEQPHIGVFGDAVADLLAEPITVPRLTRLTPASGS